MIAVIPVRNSVLPAGAEEAVCEAHGYALLIGSGATQAATLLNQIATHVWAAETHCDSAAIVTALQLINRLEDSIILPASPDGRDIAPHLAHQLHRPFFAGATSISATTVSVSRQGGLSIADFSTTTAFVATLQIGIRGVDITTSPTIIKTLDIDSQAATTQSSVTSIEILPPNASTMDLSEAPRILSGGAGLNSEQSFTQLQEISRALDASMGVTRVITDRGWAPHDRQIGTTGVIVSPRLYIALGVSGAVQHTSGLGQPEHIISVNTDAHCPMMQMSDLAIVADANEVLTELAKILDIQQQQSEAV